MENNNYAEIKKLANLLTEENIPFTFVSIFGGFQIRVYADQEKNIELDDCICHPYSHGYEQGLLETHSLNDCEGYETAEQVFEGWKKMYKKYHEKA